MAGTIVANTINTDTGLFSTQNAYQGIAKAWVAFTCPSGTITITGSFNVSSVTRIATGAYTITFTTNMANANYSAVVSSSNLGSSGGFAGVYFNPNVGGDAVPTTSSFVVGCRQLSGAAGDANYANVVVMSS